MKLFIPISLFQFRLETSSPLKNVLERAAENLDPYGHSQSSKTLNSL